MFRVELLGPLPGEMHEPAPHQQETLRHYHLLHWEERELSDWLLHREGGMEASHWLEKVPYMTFCGFLKQMALIAFGCKKLGKDGSHSLSRYRKKWAPDFWAVLWSRKYLCRLRLRGAINPNYVSGSGSYTNILRPLGFFFHRQLCIRYRCLKITFFDLSIFLLGLTQLWLMSKKIF